MQAKIVEIVKEMCGDHTQNLLSTSKPINANISARWI
jgi:hypothetical protein